MESLPANVASDLTNFTSGDKINSVVSAAWDYRPFRCEQQTNAISAASTSEQPDLIIPAMTVFKPSACRLTWIFTGASPGVTNSPRMSIGSAGAFFDYMKTYFQGNSAAVLMEVNNCNRVFKPIARCIPYEVLQTLPTCESGTGLNATSKLFPLSPVCADISGAVDSYPAKPSDAAAIEDAVTPITGGNFISEFFTGADADSVYCVKISIPMYLFQHTFWALDDYVCFPDALRLKIRFLGYNDFAFLTTSGGNSMVGAANPTAITLVVNSLTLQCAVCNVPAIAEQVKNSCLAGVKLSIPWLETSTQTLSASTNNQKFQRLFNASSGKYLKRVYISPQNSTRTTSLQLNMNNAGGLLYTALRTYLDSSPIQQYGMMSATLGEVFERIQPLYKGSALVDSRVHALNDFYVDDWTGSLARDWGVSDFEESGLLLGSNGRQYWTYEFEINTGAQCNLVQITAVLTRILMIQGNSIVLKANDSQSPTVSSA